MSDERERSPFLLRTDSTGQYRCKNGGTCPWCEGIHYGQTVCAFAPESMHQCSSSSSAGSVENYSTSTTTKEDGVEMDSRRTTTNTPAGTAGESSESKVSDEREQTFDTFWKKEFCTFDTRRESCKRAFEAGRLSGMQQAAQILRSRKEKHANLLAKNVLEIAAAEVEKIAQEKAE